MDRKSTPAELRRWALAWKTAGAFLQEERRRRLRAMTDDDVRAAMADLFQDEPPLPHEQRDCGLVEMQRLLHRLG